MKNLLFRGMTLQQIEKWENETNSVVLFDDEIGISFQKCKDEDPALVIMIDGRKKPVLLLSDQIKNLKNFLNENF
jgi:hypothetical protein